MSSNSDDDSDSLLDIPILNVINAKRKRRRISSSPCDDDAVVPLVRRSRRIRGHEIRNAVIKRSHSDNDNDGDEIADMLSQKKARDKNLKKIGDELDEDTEDGLGTIRCAQIHQS